VGQETKYAFVEMFKQDMTPSAAWEEHRRTIREKFPEDYHRHICPDYFWVFKFCRKWITDTLGSYDGVDAYVKVVEHVKNYDEKTKAEEPLKEGEAYAKVEQTDDGETCIR
jgi:hypothetical protein